MSTPATDPVIEIVDVVPSGDALALDVRNEDVFREGRLKGAVRVPIERWEAAAKAADTSLNSIEFWEMEIGALGVTAKRPVIVYDGGRMTEAARVWFILQLLGVAARVVNGGWPALRNAFTHATESGEPAEVSSVKYMASASAPRLAW